MKIKLRLDRDIKHCYASKKQDAKRRNIKFDLPLWYFALLKRSKICFYSGEYVHKGLTFERLDNTKGYIIGNVIPVKGELNSLKSDFNLRKLNKALKHQYEIIKQTENTPKKLNEKKEKLRKYFDRMMTLIDNATCPRDVEKVSKMKNQLGSMMLGIRNLHSKKNNPNKSNLKKKAANYRLIIKAVKHWSKLNDFGITMCLMYQDIPFDPDERFKD